MGLIDDDPAKRNLRIRGVPVLGTRERLHAVAVESAADMLIVPPVTELIDGQVGADDVRPLTEADLLGRHQIDTDIDAIADYITGRRVLVTGAGGSIGSELCRQLHRFGPEALIMVADIRDAERMQEVFLHHRPEVVFHTAALKHLPLLEMHPAEAVKSNVHGTLNVLEAASVAGVDRFVNISTDKAADPTSVLGYTKRIAEQLTSWYAVSERGVYLSVRFGNVLDMGEPVRIVDVARRLVAQPDRPIEIVFTGLRPGEKLHEVLLGQAEKDDRHAHPLISHCRVPAQSPAGLGGLDERDIDAFRRNMIDLSLPAVTSEATLTV